ncbi:hypothetical protein FIBSPDRAFT_1036711 [Athelia psychrophila]|uniref:C2H2-type domain-containing protein n=1 Tax=Athelia psychrophila TaxID=1759441 RepID=A0A166VBW5_9AGAM|nr:hypothetical protein FIBSPDRAFT_1036711 [Fibularhizoctonia sp. CBS 109695]
MDGTLEHEEWKDKATAIFSTHQTSGGIVNNVHGNLTIHITIDERLENLCETYPTRPPPNEPTDNTNTSTVRSAVVAQPPGSRPTGLLTDLFTNSLVTGTRYTPASADRSLIEIQVIVDIMDALIESPSLHHSAKLPGTLASLQRILELTKLAIQAYQHSPLARTLSLAIIAEAGRCRQLLKELLSSLSHYRHTLSAAMLHFIREYISSSASESGVFTDLNSKLRECHGSFAACILALGSVASSELEWGTTTTDLAELANFAFLYKQELASLQHIQVDVVIVIDHLARHLPVPTIFCKSWKDFNVVITRFCKNIAGSILIQQGDYKILTSDDEESIDPKDFSTVLQPGITVEMCIVLREPVTDRHGSEQHRCPRCNHVNTKVITVSGWVNCRRCNGLFEISPENESNVSPEVKRDASMCDIPDERALFRRISVLQDKAREKQVQQDPRSSTPHILLDPQFPPIQYSNPEAEYWSSRDSRGFRQPQAPGPTDSYLNETLQTTPVDGAGYNLVAIAAPPCRYDYSSLPKASIHGYPTLPNTYLPYSLDPRTPPNVQGFLQTQFLSADNNRGRYFSFSESGSDVSSLGLSVKQEPGRSVSTWSPAPRTDATAQAKAIVATSEIRMASQRRRCHPAKVFCKICHNNFSTTFALARHAVSHTGQRAFPCTKSGCPSRFSTDSGRVRHERSSTLHKA